MFCARCHEQTTTTDRCSQCKGPPLLDDRYRFEHLLGHGANGTTWRARHLADDTPCVVKEISLRRLSDFKSLELFKREAQVLRSLDHPAIPDHIDDLVVEEGRHVNIYIVQQYIDGKPLSTNTGSWSEPALLDFLDQLSDILIYLGDCRPPVVHRDIKPSNILVDERRYFLIDFGATAIVRGDDSGSTVAGTYGFMAPEQMRGQATAATDIYGLGATALALASGRDPSELILPGEHGFWRREVTLSAPFTALLMRMLHPDPDQRINAAPQLKWEIEQTREALARAAQPAPVSAPAPAGALSRSRETSVPERHWLDKYTRSPLESLGHCILVPMFVYVGTGVLLLAALLLATVLDFLFKPVFSRFLDLILESFNVVEIMIALFALGVSSVWLLYFLGPFWQARATAAPRWWPRWRRLNRSWLFRAIFYESFSWSIAGRLFSFCFLALLSAVVLATGWFLGPFLRFLYGYSGPGFFDYGVTAAALFATFWLAAPCAALLAPARLSWRRFLPPGLEQHWPDKERRMRFVKVARALLSQFQSEQTLDDLARLLADVRPHSAFQQECLARLALLDTRNVDSRPWQDYLQIVLASEPTAHRRRLLERVAMRVSNDNDERARELFVHAQNRPDKESH